MQKTRYIWLQNCHIGRFARVSQLTHIDTFRLHRRKSAVNHVYAFVTFVLVAYLSQGNLNGQTLGQGNAVLSPLEGETNGIRLYQASVSGTYYSIHRIESLGLTPFGSATWNAGGGAAATIGYNRVRTRSYFSLTYSPSYYAQVQFQNPRTPNQTLSISTGRRLGRKWRVGLTANGTYGTIEQFLFSPSTLGSLVSVPSTFDDLSAAVLQGQMSNLQLASIFSQNSAIAASLRLLLYGTRSLTANAGGTLSYAPTSRLSMTASAYFFRQQSFPRNGSDQPYGGVLYSASGGTASVGLQYSVSPRTHIGGSFSATRTISRLGDYYSGQGLLTVGRTLSRRWFAQVGGGAGKVISAGSSLALPRTLQYSYSGSLGFKTYAHSFLAGAGRAPADVYGLGAYSTYTAQGAWQWNRPGRAWGLGATYQWQRLEQSQRPDLEGWQASASFFQALSSHLSLYIQYTYVTYSNVYSGVGVGFAGVPINPAQSAVRASLVWSPRPGVYRQ